jgi:hypothetical protein
MDEDRPVIKPHGDLVRGLQQGVVRILQEKQRLSKHPLSIGYSLSKKRGK